MGLFNVVNCCPGYRLPTVMTLVICNYSGDLNEVFGNGNNKAGQSVTKVSFSNCQIRNTVYRARTLLKGSNTNMWINEDLTCPGGEAVIPK